MSFYAGSAGSVGSVVMQPQQIQGSAYGVPMAQSVQMAPAGMQMMPQGYPMTQSVSYAHHVPPPIQVMPMTAAMPARPQAYYQAPAMLPPVPHTAAPVILPSSSPAVVTAATSATARGTIAGDSWVICSVTEVVVLEEGYHGKDEGMGSRGDSRTSHVCKHWCSISLNRPELWRRFVFLEWKANATPEDFQTLLARCRSAPIDVGWYSEEGEAELHVGNLRLRLQQLQRMRSFTLRLPLIPHLEAALNSLLAGKAPLLQEFVVQGQMFATAPGTLPSSFLKGSFQLQILDMDEIWLSGVERLSLLSLTHITISSPLYCLSDAEAGERFGQILILLSRCPNLRRLSIKAYAPFSFDIPETITPYLKAIQLSNLREITLIFSSSAWNISPRSHIPSSLETNPRSFFNISLQEGYLAVRYEMDVNNRLTTAVRCSRQISTAPQLCSIQPLPTLLLRFLAKATAVTHLYQPSDSALRFLSANLYSDGDAGQDPLLPALASILVPSKAVGEVDTARLLVFIQARKAIGRQVTVFALLPTGEVEVPVDA
ncbi:hypothetical protein BKA70DRAFT_1406721 [Coprinopsis sp. MPI-PUGE-AT-0042]|nr:hypothetical protein BKA70DRAFT_1406721 [Coprinopsis sp. MPI-PUGE-AT-0042]